MKSVLMLFLALFAGLCRAEMAEVGKPFPPYTVQDAFGKTNTLQKTTRFVIVASEKAIAASLNEWIQTKGTNYLSEQRAEYVSDITAMPAFVTEMFARPKMKKLPFKILLARDEQFAKTYPRQKGKFTLFVLDDQHVLRAIQHLERPVGAEKTLAEK